MDYKEFATKIKSKYPTYADMDDMDLAKRMVAKYPKEYSDVVFPTSTPLGEGKATSIRAPYMSERMFGAIPEGIAQAGGQLLKVAKETPMGMGVAGAIGAGTEIARQGVQAAFGEPGAPKTFGESLGRTAKATIGGATTEGIGRGIFSGVNKVIGPKSLTEAQQSLVSAADRYGIELTPADVFKSRTWARLENTLDVLPLSGMQMNKFATNKLNAFKSVLKNIIKKQGTDLDEAQVGQVVKDVLDDAIKTQKSNTDALYASARESVEKSMGDQYQRFVNNDGLMDIAQKLSAKEKFFGPSVKSKAASFADDILANKTNYSDIENYTNLQSRLKELIREEQLASNLPGRTTPNGRKYTMMLDAVDKDFDNYYKNVNPEAKGLYDLAKASYKTESKTFGNKYIQQLAKSEPSKVVELVIKKNNVAGIKAVKDAVGEQGFKPIKEKFMTDLIEKSNIGLEEGGKAFEPTRIFGEISKYKDSTIKEIFSPQELKDLDGIFSLSASMKTAERIAGNTSRTGPTMIGAGAIGAGATAAYLAHPVASVIATLTPAGVAKLYLSKTGRNLMINGLKANPTSKEAAKFATRLGTFATLNKLMVDKQPEQK